MASCNTNTEDEFGPRVQGCLDGFDFTLLFEETILSILPLSITLLLVPFRIRHLSNRQKKVRTGWLYALKLLTFGLLVGLQICFLIIVQKRVYTQTSIASATLTIAGTMVFAYLSHLEHVKNVRPSTLIQAYFLLSSVLDIPRLRTLTALPGGRLTSSVFGTVVGVKLVIFLLELQSKKRLLLPSTRNYPPEATSSIINRLLFWWLNPLLYKGFREELVVSELYPIDHGLSFDSKKDSLRSKTCKENDKNDSLFTTLLRSYKWQLCTSIIPRCCLMGLNYAQPFLVERVLHFVQQPGLANRSSIGSGLIGAYALVYVGLAISVAKYQHTLSRSIVMVRGVLVSLIYERAIERLPQSETKDPSRAVTLMSADIERIATGMRNVHETWASPIELGIAVYLLQRQLHISILAVVFVTLVTLIASVIVAIFSGPRQKQWLQAIEERISATSAGLKVMKSLKMTGHITFFSRAISQLRGNEVNRSRQYRKLLVAGVSLSYVSSIWGPIFGFGLYSILAMARHTQPLDTVTAFTSLTIFSLYAQPILVLVDTMLGIVSALSSLKRIKDFLSSRPLDDSCSRDQKNSMTNDKDLKPINDSSLDLKDIALTSPTFDLANRDTNQEYCMFSCENLSARWSSDGPLILNELSFTLPRGSITVMTGPIGCGKTTSLHALLGELPFIFGKRQIGFRKVAYCSQKPWLYGATIKENVTGPSVYNTQWYETVVRACALEEDILCLPEGSETMLGSNDIALSGGQRVRIALARAIYSRHEMAILDDVLAGLDGPTNEHIVQHVFGVNGLFLNDISFADQVIGLSGRGSMKQHDNLEKEEKDRYQDDTITHEPKPTNPSARNEITTQAVLAAMSSNHKPHRHSGDLSTYTYYINTVGWARAFIFVAGAVTFVFMQVFPRIWIQWWVDANANDKSQSQLGRWLGVYVGLGALGLGSMVMTTGYFALVIAPNVARTFHAYLLDTINHAKLSYLVNTDVGQIVNRFSQDLELIDMQLPLSIIAAVVSCVSCMGQIILVATGPKLVAPAIPGLIVVVGIVQAFYLRTSRQLRFLEIEAKAPLFTHFLESMAGATTIRAFGWEEAYLQANSNKLEESQRPYYLLNCVQRWLTLVLDLLVAALAIILVSLATKLESGSSGFLGVALTNIVGLGSALNQLVNSYTTLEMSLGAVTRVQEFRKDTPLEIQLKEQQKLPPQWPLHGKIQFDNVSATYGDNEEMALRNISFTVEAGQKVAICGRSGSGKSTLLSCLLRLINIEPDGRISIDSINISQIARQELRSRITTLPQDAFHIPGSIRQNIDPDETASTAEIESAIERLGLTEKIKHQGGLNAPMTETAFSQGQRQMLRLAQGMLHRSNLLILDEVSSSVDYDSDALMQKVIQTHFKSHTVLAIAHRLNTVLGFDMVVMLENGQIVEQGSPRELIKKEDSLFARAFGT